MTNTPDSDTEREVAAVISAYATAASGGDSAALAAIFREDAHMWGYLGEELLSAPIQAFFEVVENAPAAEAQDSYGYEVTDVRIAGAVAVGTLTERGFLGGDFTNYFTLVREDGRWRIASKTFFLTGGMVPPR